jgi:tetratricopeptide (TPR) repeat protein
MSTGLMSAKSALFLVCLIVLSACSSTAEKTRKRQSELYFGAGTQSLMTQDYTNALTNLIKANKLDPNNPEILNNLGMAYYFKGEKNLCLKTLKKTLELDENNSDAKLNLASIYFQDGDLNHAEKLYKSVLKNLTYERQARTLYNLGILEIKRNNITVAANYFDKAIKEDSNYCPAFYQLGLLNYNRNQFNTALKNFREATMGTCYESPAAHYHLGLTYRNLKRFNEARMKFDEIDARFKETEYAAMARKKTMELGEVENNALIEETHASRKVLESPEF